jgi:hypothetical protein
MIGIAIALLIGGWLLVYCGFTGDSITAEVQAAFENLPAGLGKKRG